MLNSMRKHGTTLAVFAAVTTGLTAVVYALTKTTIAHQAALQQKRCSIRWYRRKTTTTSCKTNASWSAIQRWATAHRTACTWRAKRATDRRRAGNHRAGRLLGAIKLLVGADFNGTVLGTRVIEHHETPGLGTKSNCAFPTGFPSSAARKSKARTISAGR